MKKEEKKQPQYKQKSMFFHDRIMETAMSTKRKPAYIKIAVEDDLIKLIHSNMFTKVCEPLPIVRMILSWEELNKPKTDE